MTVEVLTFGCRLNAAESETMRGLAERAGHRGAVLVNTCAVTAEAEKQARKAVRAAHRRNPAAPILVTGCAAQIAPERWASLPGVARVVPNPDKLRPESWALAAAPTPPPRTAPPGADVPAPPRRGAMPVATTVPAPPAAAPPPPPPSDRDAPAAAPAIAAPVALASAAAPASASTKAGLDGSPSSPSRVAATVATPSSPPDRASARAAAAAPEPPLAAVAAIAADPGGSRTRAFLQVQGGCDHACTFCVIPRGRGPSFSVAPDALAPQLRRWVEGGGKEAVLTGVDIASYGADLPGRPTLGGAVRRLLALVPDLPRLRLSSLDPAALDDDLWRLLAEEPRLMPHLHLSLQHGADLVLKRMGRRHRRADALLAARRAREARSDIALGADLIAGFPTEAEEHHRDTLALVEEMNLSFLHVFPYSERPGTPAARMPPVPVPIRRARAARLREAGSAAAARFFAGRVGREEAVLFEAGNRGHTEHFAPLRLPDGAPAVPRGALRRVRVAAAGPDGLLAAAAGEAR